MTEQEYETPATGLTVQLLMLPIGSGAWQDDAIH
jgi:hypothetical protein